MEEKQELRKLSEEGQELENLRVRKAVWVQEQIQRQREAEDALFAQIKQEQQALDALRDSISQNMECTREARKYNQEFRENMDAQVYAMYGITEDKLQGMREYRNAYYRGCAFSLFFLSVVLVVLCGILHGFQSQLCLFMATFTGIQGTLLNQEGRRGRILNFCCKVLYLLMFPLMMVIFICYELKYPEYGLFLPIFTIFGIVVLVAGTSAYFLHNPYRRDRRAVEEAKGTIRDIGKAARKEVRRNRKARERAEKREAQKQQRLQKLAGKKRQRLQKRARHKLQRQQARAGRKERMLSLLKRGQDVKGSMKEVAGGIAGKAQGEIPVQEIGVAEESARQAEEELQEGIEALMAESARQAEEEAQGEIPVQETVVAEESAPQAEEELQEGIEALVEAEGPE